MSSEVTEVSGPMKSSGTDHELDSQFILRLPSLPAAGLREAIRSESDNLKDRLTIEIEPDIRHGTVRFDGWTLPATIVDLPTIVESYKTLDGKQLYKTADIGQMMICEETNSNIETVNNGKVLSGQAMKSKQWEENNYRYPHGITPPLKNVRKKRFRKTLLIQADVFPSLHSDSRL